MSRNRFLLPELQRLEPGGLEELAESIRQAGTQRIPVYPIGGGTSLGYGGEPTQPGWGLSLRNFRRVVDYPARDLTITVEAGLPVAELQALLVQQGQRWPVDVPRAAEATVGGVAACNLPGPRRYTYGTVSDCLLGLTAVDGQGMVFSAGARVVKNAAGYNLCRLLAGSVGTLAVITQLTLMVKPIPEATAFVVCEVDDWDATDRLLGELVRGPILPAAIELLTGPAWESAPWWEPLKPPSKARVAVALEGSEKEVAWQIDQLQSVCRAEAARHIQTFPEPTAHQIWQRLTEFPTGLDADGNHSAALWDFIVQAGVLPGGLVPLVVRWMKGDPRVSVLAHAGHGTAIGYFPTSPEEAGRCFQELVLPPVTAWGGHVRVLEATVGARLSAEDLWNWPAGQRRLMEGLKQRFDPYGILNPGRLGLPTS